MTRTPRNIQDLPWTHFLRRLFWFRHPHEPDSCFFTRAGVSKHNKSKWLNAVDPRPFTDMIEKVANNLELNAHEQHWLTFGAGPFVPPPPSLTPQRVPTPTQFVREFITVAEALFAKQTQASPEDLRNALLEAFEVAREHAGHAWSSLGRNSEPDSPVLYADSETAVAALIREIDTLRNARDFAGRTELLQWLRAGFSNMLCDGLQDLSPVTVRSASNVVPFPGVPFPESPGGADDAPRYFYVPKAEPRLAAGAGTVVLSEKSDDCYAFRLDWLNQVASNKGDLWLFDVAGDSMSGTLEHGDIVLIDCGRREPAHGKIYAIEEDNAVSIKRFRKRKDGTFWITSDNKARNDANRPIYPPRKLAPPIRIIGRMIWSARTWI